MVTRFDKAKIDVSAEITDSGFLKANSIVTRTGIFYYVNSDGTLRKEYRPPEEVFKADSLQSLKLIPITNGHPKERLVNPANAKAVTIGYTGENVQVQEPFLITNILITDEESIKEIKENKRRELSLGYSVDILDQQGEFEGEKYDYIQSNIIYNHLSLVDKGRAGNMARIALDGLEAEEITKEDYMTKSLKKDEEEMQGQGSNNNAELHDEIERLKKERDEVEQRFRDLKEEIDKLRAERDSLKEQLIEAEEGDFENYFEDDKKDKKTDSKREKFRNAVKNRVKLEETAKKVLDKETISKIDSMKDIDLKVLVIKQRYPNAVLDGQSEIYINGRFDGVIESLAGHNKESDDAFLKNAGKNDAIASNPEEARKRMIERSQNAWKR